MSEVKTWKEVSSIHEAVKARIEEIREERNKLIQPYQAKLNINI